MSSHRIADHEGILSVESKEDASRIEIAFDPARLTEEEIRRIANTHIRPELQAGTRRYVLRLDGQACEAAANKLGRRIEKVPGVRRAMATYVGRVLCLTFDRAVIDGDCLLEQVRGAGAKVAPIEPRRSSRPTLSQRLWSGDFNEELSCGAGVLFLVAALLAGRGAMASWLYGGAYVFCGQYGVLSAIDSLRQRTLDVDVLMVLAAVGAAAVGAPFEGALLLFLFSFSNVLQRHALERTQRAIESLLTLRPETALRKTMGGTEVVAVEKLAVGDTVVVRPGELIPVDGVVTEGGSHVDESSLTGESMPVTKGMGATVFAGTLNQSGGLEIRVDRKVEDSTLSKMVELVAEAQAEKSNTQRFLENAEQGYAAGVIGLTGLVLAIPWLFGGEDFGTAFYRAMTVMVVASPCALVISTPATVLSAIGGAARRGILIKGGSHLETAARIDVVCFDKTGTLTVGKPGLTDILTREPSAADEALRICAALEMRSEHPLGRAIVDAARTAGIEMPAAREFQSFAGKGAEAEVEGVRHVVGSERFFYELGALDGAAFSERVAALQAKGRTCIWLGRREEAAVRVLAVFALADTLRVDARNVVARLHEAGIRKVVMLTGDQAGVAEAIAREAGIDDFRAGLLPADKVDAIRELKRQGTVMMVGDGINDAPALAAAHLGVAMGAAGTDIAMETADVVLMGDRLENIPMLVGMARHARRVLRQNLAFATGVIVILVIASLGVALPLPLGVVGHEGSTVLVCLNGLRLLVYRPRNLRPE